MYLVTWTLDLFLYQILVKLLSHSIGCNWRFLATYSSQITTSRLNINYRLFVSKFLLWRRTGRTILPCFDNDKQSHFCGSCMSIILSSIPGKSSFWTKWLTLPHWKQIPTVSLMSVILFEVNGAIRSSCISCQEKCKLLIHFKCHSL